jgi:hypothetical protein
LVSDDVNGVSRGRRFLLPVAMLELIFPGGGADAEINSGIDWRCRLPDVERKGSGDNLERRVLASRRYAQQSGK